ncbi:hypothetical protein EDC04DRAFT_2615605 [Pisolithus marmoratus]|nr:hypothetical protein EDC04DRAFT_2615605 [Pisolithus marmoratus]
MTLSSIPTSLDDATHEALDQQVNEFVLPFIGAEPTGRCLDYVFLLTVVVGFSSGTLDPLYTSPLTVPSLIERQPGLESMLHTAWSNKTYRDIRNLEDVLYKAFTSPYHGKAADAFCEYLERNNAEFPYIPLRGGPHKYYGKFCSIVQSSGTGKSRLLFEDVIPAEILTANLGSKADYGARYCTFFAAVFTMINEYLSALTASRGPGDAIKQWNDSICNLVSEDRKQFFARLKTKYDAYYEIINSNAPKDAITQADDQPREQMKQPTKHEEQVTGGMRGLEYMTSAYSRMRKSLYGLFHSGECHKPKLVIALDDADPLGVTTPDGYHNSTRVSADGTLIFRPYSQLEWDHMADPLEGIGAADVAQAGHIIGYGRPLWKSTAGGSVHKVIALAMNKLFGPERSENPLLAVLSQRFYLNVNLGHHEAAQFVASSVATHLRVCISFSDDRNWSFTTYPSEPVLSCVAAAMLHARGNLGRFLDVLKEKILSGMIDVGKSGELTSRLLWLLAKDLFVRRTPHFRPVIPAADGQEWKSEFADCQVIPVMDYLRFVFGPHFCDRAGKEAKEAFKHAYINFSHWVRTDENISTSKNRCGQLDAGQWTLRHWYRTSAVQCCYNQPLVDKMIPIYFKDCPGETDLSRVSQIFISDRSQRSSSYDDLDNISRSHDSIKCHSSLPWVSILVDLGLTESAVEVKFADDPADGPCLRIYAAAIDVKTFPFLTKSHQLLYTLEKIITHDQIYGRQLEQVLQEQMQYGSSRMRRHMEWEA